MRCEIKLKSTLQSYSALVNYNFSSLYENMLVENIAKHYELEQSTCYNHNLNERHQLVGVLQPSSILRSYHRQAKNLEH